MDIIRRIEFTEFLYIIYHVIGPCFAGQGRSFKHFTEYEVAILKVEKMSDVL